MVTVGQITLVADDSTLGHAGEIDLKPPLQTALRSWNAESEGYVAAGPERMIVPAAFVIPSEGIHGSSSITTPPTPKHDDWLVGGFDRTSQWVTAGLALGLGAYLVVADTDDIRDLGDATQFLPGLAALGFIGATKDWQGLEQFAYASGTSFLLTHGVKELIDKTRPDTSANNSFPSGHTAASFTGATFIWRRYGAKWGVPASILAAYTGASRVIGQKHFADDVISGMAVGVISNLLWVDPIDERVRMSLFPAPGGAGVSVTIDPSADRVPIEDEAQYGVIPKRLFFWETGGSHVTRNDVRVPNPGGTPIDFRFDAENDPTVTAFVSLRWSDEEIRHTFSAAFAPFEVREVLKLEQDITFEDSVIAAGTTVQTRAAIWDYRVGYLYSVLRRPRAALFLGASLTVMETTIGFSTGDDGDASVSDSVSRPMVRIGAEVVPAYRWLVHASLDWWSDSEIKIADATVQVGYRLHPHWLLSLGYRRVERKIDTEELFSDMDRNQIALGVGYGW